MARHKVTIQPASADELANITFWYREAGVEAGIVNDERSEFHGRLRL